MIVVRDTGHRVNRTECFKERRSSLSKRIRLRREIFQKRIEEGEMELVKVGGASVFILTARIHQLSVNCRFHKSIGS